MLISHASKLSLAKLLPQQLSMVKGREESIYDIPPFSLL
ncbi:BnaAnng07790D [Brassica napus]|uniref:BnaAnng07790D protein n=1 Tax=Brassica napus TaxID=3708 RepID=A0A078I9R4_BRANA|nr:BnaAnng07790D [Brassica napus]